MQNVYIVEESEKGAFVLGPKVTATHLQVLVRAEGYDGEAVDDVLLVEGGVGLRLLVGLVPAMMGRAVRVLGRVVGLVGRVERVLVGACAGRLALHALRALAPPQPPRALLQLLQLRLHNTNERSERAGTRSRTRTRAADAESDMARARTRRRRFRLVDFPTHHRHQSIQWTTARRRDGATLPPPADEP